MTKSFSNEPNGLDSKAIGGFYSTVSGVSLPVPPAAHARNWASGAIKGFTAAAPSAPVYAR